MALNTVTIGGFRRSSVAAERRFTQRKSITSCFQSSTSSSDLFGQIQRLISVSDGEETFAVAEVIMYKTTTVSANMPVIEFSNGQRKFVELSEVGRMVLFAKHMSDPNLRFILFCTPS